MRQKIQTLLVGLVGIGLVACGGGDDVEITECADGTYLDEEANECVIERPDCGDDERLVEQFNECVRIGEVYCAEGTDYDEDEGVCTANADLSCGEEVADEDGECVPKLVVECGAETVVHDGQCVPTDSVCGENTADQADKEEELSCRPVDGVCGEGTTFDLAAMKCISASDLECGPGTVEVDGVCESSAGFFEDLAENPDLDMKGQDGVGTIDANDIGDQFVFVGNIDEPQMVDDQQVQDEDHYELTAEAGDWLQITVYSLGLPEPGFEFEGVDLGDSEAFYRLSDLGAGVEVTRQVAIPYDGTYELTVGNMPQMLGTVVPAGGEDWEYVGYVEVLEKPDAEQVDILEDTLEGDVRDLLDNLYLLEDMGDVDNIQMLFQALPDDADGELQVWSDATTYEETFALDEPSLSVTPPADDFYLLFDRVHAYGASTSYVTAGQEGEPLDSGDSVSEEIDLEAGEYIGVSQFNTDGEEVSAYFLDDGGDVLTMTNDLVISIADTGQNYLYWYAEQDQTVTVEIENTSGQDLESISHSLTTGWADLLEVNGPDLQTLEHDSSMGRGQRHYIEMDFNLDELLMMRIEDTSADGEIAIYDEDGDYVGGALNEYVLDAEPGDYMIEVDAEGTMSGGFTLAVEETQIFDLSETSTPGTTIPDTGTAATDVIDIPSCTTVLDIDMDIDITHSWRGDLIVSLENPAGEEKYLKARYGGSTNDIVGNFNETLGPNSGWSADVTPVEISEFVDGPGTGEWTLIVLDDLGIETPGTLSEWTLNMTCEG